MSNSGIQVVEVRIRNFRSLRQVDVELDNLTVLIGENNSGKTSFLEALHIAIGLGRRNILRDDVYLALNETSVPKDRIVTIDILIRPVDNQSAISEKFSEFWLLLWGNGISQDDDDNDFVGIRTQAKWDNDQREYITKREFLKNWEIDPNQWDKSQSKENAEVYAKYIEPFALYLMDAKRDIQDELSNRSSFWNRLISDFNLDDSTVTKVETSLEELNNEIRLASPVLKNTQKFLDELCKAIPSEKGSLSISPISQNLRNAGKSADINFATRGAQTFPLIRHGMGTRSLAVLLIFRAYIDWRQRDQAQGTLHPMLGLEEPEAHLHPQAQRALFEQIEKISGQRIVSTHSPYIASQAKVSAFRHFRKEDSSTVVLQFDITELSKEDLRKIDREVMNTRGDLLYAKAIVLFEGETEEQAIPRFAEEYWGFSPSSLGINFIGVGGAGNYLPFLRLVNSFKIPWYIFSDAEERPLRNVSAAIRQIGINIDTTTGDIPPNVIFLDYGDNFESYLVKQGYKDSICNMLNSYHENDNYLGYYMINMKNQKSVKGGGTRNYQSPQDDDRAMIDILTEGKTKYGLPLTESILSVENESKRFPPKLRKLFEKISDDLSLPKLQIREV
jgi:putative ATP-dependent endonuclease of OLD family